MTAVHVAASSQRRLVELWERPHTLRGWLASVDHKEIGRRYIVTAFIFLIAGGIEALVMRTQLARPSQQLVDPEAYDQWFTLHGITMIFWYASPVLSGIGNFVIPLLLGSRDMAFPRLNAFSFWSYLCSGVFLYASAVAGQVPHGGWFAYPPYTNAVFSPGLNMDFYALAILFLTVSTTVGAVNFIVTIFTLRAPGMTWRRTPLVMFSTLTVSWSVIFSLPALTAACLMLELDRRWGTHFFDPSRGGSVLLWQQLFWFFGHPWVYIVFLPATGMVSMLLPVMSRRPVVGFSAIAVSTVLTGAVGFGVWVHHMFAVGMAEMSMSFFSAASMVISIFSAVQVFAWIATMWSGAPVRATAMWYALGFLAIFVVGGLNGIITAFIPVDWQLHDTYFVVAHLHYVLIGANLFPVLAAVYFWFPKMTGRMTNERLGKWGCALLFAGFNATFLPMHWNGLLGMPRRIYTYPAAAGLGGLNALETLGAYLMAIGFVVILCDFARALRRGPFAPDDPWGADTLEWATASPPESYAFPAIPLVASRHPLWDEHDEFADVRAWRALDHTRATLSSTVSRAEPFGLAIMPEDTLAPLLLALTLAVTCVAALLLSSWAMVAGGVASLVVAGTWLWPEPVRVA